MNMFSTDAGYRQIAATDLPVVVERVVPRHRTIPLSRSRHIRGFYPVRAGHAAIPFESLLERNVIAALAKHSSVRLTSQPVTIYYRVGTRSHRYTPDLLIEFDDVPTSLQALGFVCRTLIECKPACRVLEFHDSLSRHFRAAELGTSLRPLLITDTHLERGALEVGNER